MEVVLVLLENISPPPAGPLTIDHEPVVPEVAAKLMISLPQETIWSGPAKAVKQGLPELSKAIVISF